MTDPTEPTKHTGGLWKPGQSGNPAGRAPKYGATPVRELRARIGEHIDVLVERVLLAALAGDMTAAKLLLDKVLPNVKPESLPLALSTVTGDTWSAKATALYDAALAGDIAPDVAGELLGALAKVVNVEAIEELRAKLRELEDLA